VSRDLVFEIGVEEIPSAALYDAIVQLRNDAEKALRDARLEYAAVNTYGAPRRLVLAVERLADQQADVTESSRGPAVKAAFDADGNPTKAAEGFARGKGVPVTSLERREDGGGEYVFAVIERAGLPVIEVLPDLLASLAAGIDWPKSQRWGDGDARFIRPVRWLLALYGSTVVPVRFAGLEAGRYTYGHRFLAVNPLEVPAAEEYSLVAQRGLFMYDQDERARLIRETVEAVAAQVGASAVMPDKTFSEVVNLSEWPSVGIGRFDDEFLEVPREVLETAMESHQRYFPMQGADGALLDTFVVVHNGDPELTEPIVAGHERVIRARLADAAFFYREDLKVSLEDRLPSLESIVFHEKLGTLGAKVARVEKLAGALADQAGVTPAERASAVRAAHLCKSDLVSHVVVEFPSLQGVMGRYYALASNEEPAVAEAIVEHYRPRFAGDGLPATVPGALASAADKLDTICGIFAIGQGPTGSADPYALRRSAIGVLAMVLDGGLALTLDESIAEALDGYGEALPGLDKAAVGTEVKEFFLGRLQGMLRDRGHAYDTVDAVLEVAGDDPADALSRVEALSTMRDSEVIADLSVAFARAKNLGRAELGIDADRSIMGPDEAALLDPLEGSKERVAQAMAARDYPAVLGTLAELRGPIDVFFDAVLVMDPDEKLRDNRLRLLNRFVALFGQFADFGKLAG
jgi:glycyl-tRNA synthetase beta chain